MRQQYSQYNVEDHSVWKLLFQRQVTNLFKKGSKDYLNCLAEMEPVLNARRIPDFRELDAMMLDRTGWSIEVVEGLIPVEDFFALLAKRRFCSSTWLRSRSQLDYLEEPDMFHDIFGHVPLLIDPIYADFMQKFGELGMSFAGNKAAVDAMERLYWYTIEFGLIEEEGQNKVYGAGIVSSFGETNHIFDDEIEALAFQREKVMQTQFITSEIQNKYFVINDLKELFLSLKDVKPEAVLAAV